MISSSLETFRVKVEKQNREFMGFSMKPHYLCPEAIRAPTATAGAAGTGRKFRRAQKSNQSPAGKLHYTLRSPGKSLVETTLSALVSKKRRRASTPAPRSRVKTRRLDDLIKDERSLIFGMDRVLGKRIPVGPKTSNLSWTILNSESQEDSVHCKRLLPEALEVMNECFTKSQAEDIIFNRESGFYTVVLESSWKVVCAANVRVHEMQLAEVPMVGTRFDYQKQGMCKILMKELENWLMEFGVERVVLPSCKKPLKYWTSTSMGYKQISKDEKAEVLSNYDCMDFKETVMCEKRLFSMETDYSSDTSTISHEEHNA